MNQAESINIDLPQLMSVQPLEAADTFVGQPESYNAAQPLQTDAV